MSPKKPKNGGDTRAKAAANGKKVGRPAKPKVPTEVARISKDVAGQVLEQVDQVKMWLQFLHPEKELKDLTDVERTERKWAIVQLENRRYGLCARSEFDQMPLPDMNAYGLRVIVEHIGRPQDQAAAKAKFAGRSVE